MYLEKFSFNYEKIVSIYLVQLFFYIKSSRCTWIKKTQKKNEKEKSQNAFAIVKKIKYIHTHIIQYTSTKYFC